jgi:hypothetical protein
MVVIDRSQETMKMLPIWESTFYRIRRPFSKIVQVSLRFSLSCLIWHFNNSYNTLSSIQIVVCLVKGWSWLFMVYINL